MMIRLTDEQRALTARALAALVPNGKIAAAIGVAPSTLPRLCEREGIGRLYRETRRLSRGRHVSSDVAEARRAVITAMAMKGATCREIGKALGISYQRVQQLVSAGKCGGLMQARRVRKRRRSRLDELMSTRRGRLLVEFAAELAARGHDVAYRFGDGAGRGAKLMVDGVICNLHAQAFRFSPDGGAKRYYAAQNYHQDHVHLIAAGDRRCVYLPPVLPKSIYVREDGKTSGKWPPDYSWRISASNSDDRRRNETNEGEEMTWRRD